MTTNYLQQRQAALSDAVNTVDVQLNFAVAQVNTLDIADPARASLQHAADTLQQVRDELTAELQLLADAEPDQLTDRAAEQTLLIWLAGLPADEAAQRILDAAAAEPVHRALGSPAAVTPELAAAVLALQPGPRTTAAAVHGAAGDPAFDDLIAIALVYRLGTFPDDVAYPFRDVAVLLPLRLETLFTSDGHQSTMFLRLIPDEASILRHDPVPTSTEIRLLTAMWADLLAALDPATLGHDPVDWLNRDVAGAAWQTFCSQVGAARAAWLAGTFPPTLAAGGVVHVDAPAATDHESPPNRVGGLPTTIDIWCSFNGQDPTYLATTNGIDAAALDFDDLVDQSDRWWVSWQTAKDVGLGVEKVLPHGLGPADITALYAVGVGDGYPDEHFAALIDAGDLARLPLGVPTNTVDGQPAADLGHGPEAWRRTAARRLHERLNGPDGTDADLATALAGAGATLPPVPGTDQLRDLDQMLVGALGPALWGHHLRDLWGLGREGEKVGDWTQQNLRPEGPLTPIRIAEQPYGLLPVSAMGRWSVSGDTASSSCEPQMLGTLLKMRAIAAAAADKARNAVGANTARLLDLIGHEANSQDYAYRLFFPAALWESLYTATTGVPPDKFEEALDAYLSTAFDVFGTTPARSYLAGGGYSDLKLPLVMPTRFPGRYYRHEGDFLVHDDQGNPVLREHSQDSLAQLIDEIIHGPAPAAGLLDSWQVLPDSLLVRLMLYSRTLAEAGVYRADQGDDTPLLDPLVSDDATPPVLQDASGLYDANSPHNPPAGEIQKAVIDGLIRIREALKNPDAIPQLERALRATLDSTYRVDPWFTGMANRRLASLAAQPATTRFRLGVYGWVDGPIIGAPGTTTGGLLHAPSHAQALTAVVLRDRYLSDQTEDPAQADRWSMQLESARIRLADEIADEVRIGCHIFEVVGRQVERVMGDDTAVVAVRHQFPLLLAQKADGRVCHGMLALQNLLGTTPVVPVSADQKLELEHIRDALDCYGDLLIAEAVHQVVTGRAEIAGAAMDAAAGLGTTPTFNFTETPLAAEGLSTAVIAAVPWVAGGAPGPATIADPAVAAAVIQMTGPATGWTWIKPATAGGPAVTATLADLGLQPIDTVVLSPDQLTALIAHRLGGAPDLANSAGAGFHRRAADLIRSLGNQPAFLRDLAPADAGPAAIADIAALDDAVTTELLARYAALRASADQLKQRLSTALTNHDVAGMAKGLRDALLWGITPHVDTARQDAVLAAMLDNTAPADTALLPELVTQAIRALQHRIDIAPQLPPPVPPAQQMARAAESIGRAIAELAAPEGQLAVLAKVRAADLIRVTGLAGGADAGLADDWLPVAAAVRPNMARLEAFQLEASVPRPGPARFAAFGSWSNSPADHWLTGALAELREKRTHPGTDPHIPLPRFVAAYCTTDLSHENGYVGIGLIDSWTEAVPRPRQTTTAAFGFNAPGSRAPQAILIAVPPLIRMIGVQMTAATLVDIVADTRQLARARAARADQLGPLLTAIPTTMFQGNGWTGVRLDTSTHL